MYYNKILKAWVIDPFDYFLLSALVTSLLTAYWKKYQSEEYKKNRLRKSIIKKSLIINSSTTTLSQPDRVKKIGWIALEYPFVNVRGGSNAYDLAAQIEDVILKLVVYMKQRSVQGALKIIFRNGNIILELILKSCGIYLDYEFMWIEGQTTTQIIVFAIVSGGTAGFTISWLSAGASLITPILLLTTLMFKSVSQQFCHNIDFAKIEQEILNLMENPTVRDTIKITFQDEHDVPLNSIEMIPDEQPSELVHRVAEKLSITEDMQLSTGELEFDDDFNIVDSLGNAERFNNNNYVNKNPKSKTVKYSDFINGLDEDEFIDAEIIQKQIQENPVRVRIDENKEL